MGGMKPDRGRTKIVGAEMPCKRAARHPPIETEDFLAMSGEEVLVHRSFPRATPPGNMIFSPILRNGITNINRSIPADGSS